MVSFPEHALCPSADAGKLKDVTPEPASLPVAASPSLRQLRRLPECEELPESRRESGLRRVKAGADPAHPRSVAAQHRAASLHPGCVLLRFRAEATWGRMSRERDVRAQIVVAEQSVGV